MDDILDVENCVNVVKIYPTGISGDKTIPVIYDAGLNNRIDCFKKRHGARKPKPSCFVMTDAQKEEKKEQRKQHCHDVHKKG